MLVESRSPAGFADNQKERDPDTAMVHFHKFMGHTYKWELRLVNDLHSFFDSDDGVIDSLVPANRECVGITFAAANPPATREHQHYSRDLIQCGYFTL